MAVALTWSVDPQSAKVTQFRVFRNGVGIAELERDETSYEDVKIVPGRKYTYQVRAEAGAEQSEGAMADITIEAPPLSEARLDGVFDIDAKVLSSSGFKWIRKVSNYDWDFTPKCKTGACRVAWKDRDLLVPHGILERKGATYTGTYKGWFDIQCFGGRSTSLVKIKLRVMQAKALRGEWQVTRVRGTLTTSDSPQLGCVASRKTESLRGKFAY